MNYKTVTGERLYSLNNIDHCFVDVRSLTYSGCFTLQPGVTTPKDIVALGWINMKVATQDGGSTCIKECVRRFQKYAAVEIVSIFSFYNFSWPRLC